MSGKKLWKQVRSGSRDIVCNDPVRLAEAFGLVHVRTSGSHRIFNHPDIPGILKFQPDGYKAKPCQVGRFIKLVEKYGLRLGDAGDDQ